MMQVVFNPHNLQSEVLTKQLPDGPLGRQEIRSTSEMTCPLNQRAGVLLSPDFFTQVSKKIVVMGQYIIIIY